MSEVEPPPIEPTEPDPTEPDESEQDKRIYRLKVIKGVVSAVLAGLAVLVSFADVLPGWLMIIAAVLIAGLGTFVVPPKSWGIE